MKSSRPSFLHSYQRCQKLLTLLFLSNGFSIAKGDDNSISDFETRSGPPFQYKFAEMLIWSKPVAQATTAFVNETQREVILQVLEDCAKSDFFFGLNPTHMSAISRLTNVLLEQPSSDDWLEMAAGFREQVNPHVWLRAVFSSAILRKDLQSLRFPPVVEVIPSTFIPGEDLDRFAHVSACDESCVKVDGSIGVDNGPEHALWYFREAIMVNSHHWFWHLSYQGAGYMNRQPDRNGELFYFMHHDYLSRYHSERLSAGLPPAEQWNLEVGTRIPLGYNPHLHDGNSGLNWSPRPRRIAVKDIPKDNAFGFPSLSIEDRTIQKKRILAGISNGSLIATNGTLIPLDSKYGITLLGNVVQANIYSVNPGYYGFGGIHNTGHVFVCIVLDPSGQLGVPPGVMGDTGTSMRDPVFVPYHKEIDSVFQTHKNTLTPYQLQEGEWPLLLQGVTLTSLSVQSQNLPLNELHTFWNTKTFDLSRGLDFKRPLDNGPLLICEKILDHHDFQYQLQIDSPEANTATVRLFMGPRQDLNGSRYTLEEQRNFMFILDTFTVQLHEGLNSIRRNSTETPLTIDFNQGLDELGSANLRPFDGCGWPQHLLIPKGSKEGLSFDLFAILTNAKEDQVEPAEEEEESSQLPYIYCGLQGKKYPDARPMGYPFDRKFHISDIDIGVTSDLEELAQTLPNSALTQVRIIHFDETRNVQRNH